MVKNHHVAWADRIGINKQWARDIQVCGNTFGTEYYPVMIRRFRNNIPNIKNGPQLKDIIDKHVNNNIEEWKMNQLNIWRERNPQRVNHPASIRAKQDDIEYAANEELFKFILQLLEDNGFGFYESNIEGDDVGLDD